MFHNYSNYTMLGKINYSYEYFKSLLQLDIKMRKVENIET